jgi:hypothetical protein
MNFCPGSKNSIIGKTPEKTGRYDRIINELCHFYKVSLIKTGLMFHKYHLLNLLSDILTILGIIWACKVFLDCF